MGAAVTQGDLILAAAIDAALVAQPFADPLIVDLGFQGGGHGEAVAPRRADAGASVAGYRARRPRGGAAACRAGGGAMSKKDEERMDAIAQAVADGATLPAAYRKAGVSAVAGMGLWARICARLGVPVAGDGR